MHYSAYFTDIEGREYTVEIMTEEGGGSEYELTLGGSPVIISCESSGLYTPIKTRSCTIDIVSDGGLFDLYTTDPQGVKVVVYNGRPDTYQNIIFKGYATPMQYGQDWTTLDNLSLECVDMISTLKEIPYVPWHGTYKCYIDAERLISHCIARAVGEENYFTFRWEWPQEGCIGANGYMLHNTKELLRSVKFNEANFFDDDDEKTPWTYYQVLEEVCKYFNVSCVPYEDRIIFIDYDYVHSDNATYRTWLYTLDREDLSEITQVTRGKQQKWLGDYAGGTAQVATDDYYNVISVAANRYDIDKIIDDLYDHKNSHISINKEVNKYLMNQHPPQQPEFGSGLQPFTVMEVNGWWLWASEDVATKRYAYKTYCRLDPLKTGWTQHWYHPDGLTEITPAQNIQGLERYYDQYVYDLQAQNPGTQLDYNHTPENKWINSIGATFVRYAALEDMKHKPVSLDWKTAVMFQCAHPCMRTPSVQGVELPQGQTAWGKFMMYDMWDGTLEKIALSYDNDYEMCFSPHQGTSWLVVNAKLWYQQNHSNTEDNAGNTPIPRHYNGDNEQSIRPVDLKQRIQMMMPLEDLTDWKGYPFLYYHNGIAAEWYCRKSFTSAFGYGWTLLKLRLRIGDKYWDGTQWTTTDSTFFVRFYKEFEGREYDTGQAGVKDKVYDAFQMLDWMEMISTTDYEDKVGKQGYCIPIEAADNVSGLVHLDIYMPRMLPKEPLIEQYKSDIFSWYEISPIVYMKDFSVDYIYTDETEWYLDEETDTKDIKYVNDPNEAKEEWEYKKNITMKINTWQENRPIAKSYPIINFTGDGTLGNPANVERLEYIDTMYEPFVEGIQYTKQEESIISRQLAHYNTPRKMYSANRHNWVKPWAKIHLGDASELSDPEFVVDTQEFDVRYMNNRVTLIENK